MSIYDEIRSKGGRFGRVAHSNSLASLGTAVLYAAVPFVTGSAGVTDSLGLRPTWMEIYAAGGENSLAGVRWNFDISPATNYALLPPGHIIPYPVSEQVNTLFVRADGNSAGLRINWFVPRPNE